MKPLSVSMVWGQCNTDISPFHLWHSYNCVALDPGPCLFLNKDQQCTVYFNSSHAGNFSCFCCPLLIFFKFNFFKNFFHEHYQSVKQFGSDQDRHFPVLIWVQTVCKGSQRTTKVTTCKERVNSKVLRMAIFAKHSASELINKVMLK